MKPSKAPTPRARKSEGTAAAITRRGFLNGLWAVLGLAALAEFLWLAVSFLRPAKPGKNESQADTFVSAGALATFAPGTVTAFQNGAFYLVRLEDGGLLALSCKCTHLGCTVPWVEKEKKFLCPCHASAFDITGCVITSPAARPLDTFTLTVENDIVKVDTGRRFKRSSFDPGQLVYPKARS